MVMLLIYMHRLKFWWMKRVVLIPTLITFDVLAILLEREISWSCWH